MRPLIHPLRGPAAAAVATLLLSAGGGTAFADDIYNTLDTTIDAVAETITLAPGGATGGTTFKVDPTNGDGKNGCNLTGSTTLVTAVTSSNPAVASVSPGSVTFDSCGSVVPVTVTSAAAGTTTIALSVTSNTSGGTFNLAPATFTVVVSAPAKTATTTTLSCPASVVYTGSAQTPCTASTTGTGGFSASPTVTYSANTAVGTATASATYAGDATHEPSTGSATFAITKAPSVTTLDCPASVTYTGSALQPCSASVTGAGGLDQPVPVVYTDNVDAGTATAAAGFGGDSGHTASDATTTFAVGQAAATCTVTPYSGTYDGTAHGLTGTCTGVDGVDLSSGLDLGGSFTDAGTASVDWSLDGGRNHADQTGTSTVTIAKAPSSVVLICDSPRTYTGSAIEPCSASAGGVALAPVPLAVSYTDNTDAGTATASAGWAGDANHLGSTGSEQFTILKAASTVTVTCPAGPFYFTGSPVTPACTARATGVGALDVAVTPVTFSGNTAVGTATASATYLGDANHTGSTGSSTFQISAWTLNGFFKPVDMGDVWNTVKGGSTVPLKFRVFAGSTELTSTSAVKSFSVQAISCTTSDAQDAIEELSTTGGTSLRYDTTGAQFVQNWQTPKKAGTCYRTTMTTQDGSTISAKFMLK